MRQIFAASFLVPFGLFFPAACVAGHVARGEPWRALWWFPLLGVTPLFYGARYVLRAIRGRASDLLISADGLRVEGGPRHGLAVPWRDIDPAATAKVAASSGDGSRDDLVLATRDGRRLRLASCWSADLGWVIESSGFDATVAAIRAACAGPPAATSKESPSLVKCPACGAAAPPVDATETRCAYCGARVPIPDEVRTQLRRVQNLDEEQRSLDARVASLVTRLPTARRSNAWIVMSALVLIVLSPTFIVGAWFLNIVGGFFRTRVAERRSLRALALGFRPLRAATPQGGLRCRSCAAPLPAPVEEQLVVRCAYCGMPNVRLGIDLGVEFAGAAAAASSLKVAFADYEEAHRARRRASWSLTGLVVAVGAVAILGPWAWRRHEAHVQEQAHERARAAPTVQIAGTWHSSLQGAPFDGMRLAIDFGQAPDGTVHGDFEPDDPDDDQAGLMGVIHATVAGRHLDGTWESFDGPSGRVSLEFAAEGKSFTGTWSFKGRHGTWRGTRP